MIIVPLLDAVHRSHLYSSSFGTKNNMFEQDIVSKIPSEFSEVVNPLTTLSASSQTKSLPEQLILFFANNVASFYDSCDKFLQNHNILGHAIEWCIIVCIMLEFGTIFQKKFSTDYVYEQNVKESTWITPTMLDLNIVPPALEDMSELQLIGVKSGVAQYLTTRKLTHIEGKQEHHKEWSDFYDIPVYILKQSIHNS
tara:strand:+ start:374 stop:964 length:591 start_codon:yes stop_codon:yes gene_type:complete